jgi:hypothetical protein
MSGRRFTGPTENVPRIKYVPFVRRGSAVPVPAPAPARTTLEAGATSHADPDKLQALKAFLNGCPTGAAAVKYIEDHKLSVEFCGGHATFCRETKIVVGDAWSAASAALSLVHEVHHARTSIEGAGANVRTDTRDDFVDKMLRDEVGAKIDAVRARNELVANGTLKPGGYGAEYNNALKTAVDALRRENPSASETEVAAAGEKAGYDAVRKHFTEVARTSNSNELYPDYFRRMWDERHPSAPRSAR